jgi:hypothetical protein
MYFFHGSDTAGHGVSEAAGDSHRLERGGQLRPRPLLPGQTSSTVNNTGIKGADISQ